MVSSGWYVHHGQKLRIDLNNNNNTSHSLIDTSEKLQLCYTHTHLIDLMNTAFLYHFELQLTTNRKCYSVSA